MVWAAQIAPRGAEPTWLEGRADSQPSIVQSECVPALIEALASTPPGADVEVISPASLRYLVEGRAFSAGTLQHRLAELARDRRIWARYALGELEPLTDACLSRASANLAPLRWPTNETQNASEYVLYTDGGCTRETCAAAWVLCRRRASL